MHSVGRALVWLLDSMMLFAFPTAKTNWGNRGLVLLLLVLVGVAVLAKIHHGF